MLARFAAGEVHSLAEVPELVAVIGGMADALDVPLGTQTGLPAWTAALDQAKARAFEQILA